MNTIKRFNQYKSTRQAKNVNPIQLFLSTILILGLMFAACEGPTGPEGPRGEVGPIGPAGEDGSVMWAGPSAPTESIGSEGDYYLNSITGEFYGPKDADGWGNPIIVLMGEDGEDGADGSQIFSSTLPPAETLGKVGDYYLDRTNYELYGPKTESGWGSPINLKGADGNANVTRYIFPGYDFENNYSLDLKIPGIDNESEMQQSAWLIYLVERGGYYSIPGYALGGKSRYDVYHSFSNSTSRPRGMYFFIFHEEGPGEVYDEVEIVRIEASNTVDLTSFDGKSLIPDYLNTLNYHAVATHYGFSNTAKN